MTWTRTQLQNMKEAMEAIAKDIPSTEEQQKMTQYWQQQANKQALSEEQRQAAGYIVNGGLTKSIQMQKKAQLYSQKINQALESNDPKLMDISEEELNLFLDNAISDTKALKDNAIKFAERDNSDEVPGRNEMCWPFCNYAYRMEQGAQWLSFAGMFNAVDLTKEFEENAARGLKYAYGLSVDKLNSNNCKEVIEESKKLQNDAIARLEELQNPETLRKWKENFESASAKIRELTPELEKTKDLDKEQEAIDREEARLNDMEKEIRRKEDTVTELKKLGTSLDEEVAKANENLAAAKKKADDLANEVGKTIINLNERDEEVNKATKPSPSLDKADREELRNLAEKENRWRLADETMKDLIAECEKLDIQGKDKDVFGLAFGIPYPGYNSWTAAFDTKEAVDTAMNNLTPEQKEKLNRITALKERLLAIVPSDKRNDMRDRMLLTYERSLHKEEKQWLEQVAGTVEFQLNSAKNNFENRKIQHENRVDSDYALASQDKKASRLARANRVRGYISEIARTTKAHVEAELQRIDKDKECRDAITASIEVEEQTKKVSETAENRKKEAIKPFLDDDFYKYIYKNEKLSGKTTFEQVQTYLSESSASMKQQLADGRKDLEARRQKIRTDSERRAQQKKELEEAKTALQKNNLRYWKFRISNNKATIARQGQNIKNAGKLNECMEYAYQNYETQTKYQNSAAQKLQTMHDGLLNAVEGFKNSFGKNKNALIGGYSSEYQAILNQLNTISKDNIQYMNPADIRSAMQGLKSAAENYIHEKMKFDMLHIFSTDQRKFRLRFAENVVNFAENQIKMLDSFSDKADQFKDASRYATYGQMPGDRKGFDDWKEFYSNTYFDDSLHTDANTKKLKEYSKTLNGLIYQPIGDATEKITDPEKVKSMVAKAKGATIIRNKLYDVDPAKPVSMHLKSVVEAEENRTATLNKKGMQGLVTHATGKNPHPTANEYVFLDEQMDVMDSLAGIKNFDDAIKKFSPAPKQNQLGNAQEQGHNKPEQKKPEPIAPGMK